jgi:hypothetical protein
MNLAPDFARKPALNPWMMTALPIGQVTLAFMDLREDLEGLYIIRSSRHSPG